MRLNSNLSQIVAFAHHHSMFFAPSGERNRHSDDQRRHFIPVRRRRTFVARSFQRHPTVSTQNDETLEARLEEADRAKKYVKGKEKATLALKSAEKQMRTSISQWGDDLTLNKDYNNAQAKLKKCDDEILALKEQISLKQKEKESLRSGLVGKSVKEKITK